MVVTTAGSIIVRGGCLKVRVDQIDDNGRIEPRHVEDNNRLLIVRYV